MLRAIGVSLAREGQVILDDVSLLARAGEVVVVEGGRGAGKSTLLEVAAALRRPDRGELWIADRDVTGLQRGSLPYVRRNVGYAGAALPLLPDRSARQNLTWALRARGHAAAYADDACARALARLGLQATAERAVSRLSDGARRLVALARALADAPPVLVVDDPSCFLTAGDVEMVSRALFAASASGVAVLCATADAAFAGAAARNGARRLRIEAGRVLPGVGPVAVPVAPRPIHLAGAARATPAQAGRWER